MTVSVKSPVSRSVPATLGFRAIRKYNAQGGVISRSDIWRLPNLSSGEPKRHTDDLRPEEFNRLLSWLDPDRDRAGDKYEVIRHKLVKMFVCRAATIPEELADRTINRVARKLADIEQTYSGEPSHYFYGVAHYIFKEWIKQKTDESKRLARMPVAFENFPEDEHLQICLQNCLTELSTDDRRLVVSYYEGRGQAKIDRRRHLAEELGMTGNAIRIRACRIRAALMRCVARQHPSTAAAEYTQQ